MARHPGNQDRRDGRYPEPPELPSTVRIADIATIAGCQRTASRYARKYVNNAIEGHKVQAKIPRLKSTPDGGRFRAAGSDDEPTVSPIRPEPCLRRKDRQDSRARRRSRRRADGHESQDEPQGYCDRGAHNDERAKRLEPLLSFQRLANGQIGPDQHRNDDCRPDQIAVKINWNRSPVPGALCDARSIASADHDKYDDRPAGYRQAPARTRAATCNLQPGTETPPGCKAGRPSGACWRTTAPVVQIGQAAMWATVSGSVA